MSVVFDDASEEEREDLFLDTGTRSYTKPRESRQEREEKIKKLFADDGVYMITNSVSTIAD
jgi:hypothetical protein